MQTATMMAETVVDSTQSNALNAHASIRRLAYLECLLLFLVMVSVITKQILLNVIMTVEIVAQTLYWLQMVLGILLPKLF